MILDVTTHDGNEYAIEIDVYNPEELYKMTNDSSLENIRIGDLVTARINFKSAYPKIISEIKENS